jgi:hypothetical protein
MSPRRADSQAGSPLVFLDHASHSPSFWTPKQGTSAHREEPRWRPSGRPPCDGPLLLRSLRNGVGGIALVQEWRVGLWAH